MEYEGLERFAAKIGVKYMINLTIVLCLLVLAMIALLSLYVDRGIYKLLTDKKASDKFVVCTVNGEKLVPQALYDCEADARKHSLLLADKVIIRVRQSEVDLLRSVKHVSH